MFPGEPSVAVKQMWIFKFFGEVSNEALSWLGVYRKRRKTGPARQVHQYDPQAATPSFILIFPAIAESVLEGINGWQLTWYSKKVTPRVTVLERTERKQSGPTSTALSTI